MAEIFRYLEFAEESTSGVAETTPEMSCDAQSCSPGLPDNPEMEYPGSMGSGKTIHRPGFYSTKPKFEIGCDLKILARMLYFVSGKRIIGAVTEGDGSPSDEPDTSIEYIYPSSDILLPTFTLWIGIDLKDEKGEFIVPGCVLDKFALAVENEFITIKGDMQGKGEFPGDLKSKDELKLNEDYPLASYECNVHMRDKGSSTPWGDDTCISRDVKKLELSLERSAKAEDGQGLGSRFPYYIPVGEKKIGYTFDYTYLTKKWYNLMHGGNTGPQEKIGSTEFEMMMEFDAGKYGSVQIYFPRVIVTSAPVDSKGRETITQSISIDAYQESISIPTSPDPTVVYSEFLATFTHKFEDKTTDFDGPALWDVPETP